MLPTYRELDFDLEQIPVTNLVLRAACHPLALGQGGEGCGGARGDPFLVGCWDSPNQHFLGAMGIREEQPLLSLPAAAGAGVGARAHLCAGGVEGQGCRKLWT